MSQPVRRTIHYTEVPDLSPDDLLYREWKTFRRELPRLLAEGHEGKFVLLKGDAIIGLFATQNEALNTGRQLYLLQPFMVQQALTEEPLLRISPYWRLCRT